MTPKTVRVLRSSCADSNNGKFRVHLDEREWELLCAQFDYLEAERARLDALRASLVYQLELQRDCRQEKCALPTGCTQHWANRNTELSRELGDTRRVLEGICGEFERAVQHADWRSDGSKGMSAPFTGDFASATQLPSVVAKMRWWMREFKRVLGDDT